MFVTTKGVVLEVPITPQDLQKGSKILAADGTSLEVVKLEVQKTNKLLELERLGAVEDNIQPEKMLLKVYSDHSHLEFLKGGFLFVCRCL